jgi:hypothetical protein
MTPLCLCRTAHILLSPCIFSFCHCKSAVINLIGTLFNFAFFVVCPSVPHQLFPPLCLCFYSAPPFPPSTTSYSVNCSPYLNYILPPLPPCFQFIQIPLSSSTYHHPLKSTLPILNGMSYCFSLP